MPGFVSFPCFTCDEEELAVEEDALARIRQLAEEMFGYEFEKALLAGMEGELALNSAEEQADIEIPLVLEPAAEQPAHA